MWRNDVIAFFDAHVRDCPRADSFSKIFINKATTYTCFVPGNNANMGYNDLAAEKAQQPKISALHICLIAVLSLIAALSTCAASMLTTTYHKIGEDLGMAESQRIWLLTSSAYISSLYSKKKLLFFNRVKKMCHGCFVSHLWSIE